MITDYTVFILGEGANVPFGFPTGKGLREYICKKFRGNIEKLIRDDPNSSPDKLRKVSEKAKIFTETFFRSSISSIDLFLARNRSFTVIGKKAIIISILEKEKNSHFRENMSDRNQDWYTHLF